MKTRNRKVQLTDIAECIKRQKQRQKKNDFSLLYLLVNTTTSVVYICIRGGKNNIN